MDPSFVETLLSCRGHLVFTLFFIFAGYHFWNQSDDFRVWASGMRETFQWCWQRSRSSSGMDSDDKAADEEWVRQQMDELRIKYAYRAAKGGGVWIFISLFLLTLIWTAVREDPVLASVAANISLILLIVYAVCLCVNSGMIGLTQFRIRAFYVLVCLMFLARVLSAEVRSSFFVLQNGRLLLRALLGLMVLDTRVSLVMNSMWTLALLYHMVWRMQIRLPEFAGVQWTWGLLSLELWGLVMLQAFLLFAELFVESHVRLNLSMRVAKSVQQAVRRLLSVICDAEVHLTGRLEICDPSHKVAHMLAPDLDPIGGASVEGRSFGDFVPESDSDRFFTFLAYSAGASEEAQHAASLHLNLCDTTGRCFPVEIFHVNFLQPHSGRSPEHLIGIREEASASAELRGQALRQDGRPPQLQGVPGGSAAPQALASQPDPAPDDAVGLRSAAEARNLVSGIFPQEFNAPHDSADASSVTSIPESGVSVQTVVHRLKLPVMSSMEVHLDPLAKDLPLKELRCCFKGECEPDQQQEPPMFRDFVHESVWEGFARWVQSSLNIIASGREPDLPLGGPLLLQWPSSGQLEEDLLLQASTVTIDFAESGSSRGSSRQGSQDREEEKGEGEEGGEEEDEEEEEGGEDLSVVVRLQDFHQLIVRDGLHRRRRRRPASQGSGIRASVPQGQMPSIIEASGQEGSKNTSGTTSAASGGKVSDSPPGDGPQGVSAKADGEHGA